MKLESVLMYNVPTVCYLKTFNPKQATQWSEWPSVFCVRLPQLKRSAQFQSFNSAFLSVDGSNVQRKLEALCYFQTVWYSVQWHF
jgi:hypothetical protein